MLYVKQISLFLENAKGTLGRMTKLLGEQGIDLIALSIADTEHYGIARLIVDDLDKAYRALKDAGYTVKLTDVIAVCIPDKPGGLAQSLNWLYEADISVEYVYSFVRSPAGDALVIMHLSDLEKGAQVLTEHGVHLLDAGQLNAL